MTTKTALDPHMATAAKAGRVALAAAVAVGHVGLMVWSAPAQPVGRDMKALRAQHEEEKRIEVVRMLSNRLSSQ